MAKARESDRIRIELRVNGKPVVVEVPSKRPLLHFLREELDLTGAKDGCSEGTCGACTVIVNGKATKSCITTMDRCQGADVQTVEGLAADGRLHPLQVAFLEGGALQCGFCTPGLIMSGKALLDRNPRPSVDEIKKAMVGNLCRCHEYQRIITALQRAAEIGAGDRREPWPIHEAPRKVTGEIRYAADMKLPGMLHCVARRSDHPHAELLAIDIEPARAMPGVRAVLTHRDVKGTNLFGLISEDQPVLCRDKVRYIGDPLALVVADTREQAEAAAAAIRVEYKVLPVVSDPVSGMRPGAPRVHEAGNILIHTQVVRGDADAAFAECDVVIEDTYETPMVEHGYIEPESGVAYPNGDGRVVVVASGQNPHAYQRQICRALGLPLDRVRVIHAPTGGSFGGKHDINVQIHLVMAVLATGRPVKMVWTRLESMMTHPKRHAVRMHYKTGATRDGRLRAFRARLILDKGAYASEGAATVEACTVFAAGPYRIPNVDIEAWGVYTNNPTGGAFRGFGVPQACFAAEVQMDRLARALGMDPIEFRARNILREGDETPCGQRLDGPVPMAAVLEAAREALARETLPVSGPDERIGVGIGAMMKNSGMGLGVPEPVEGVAQLEPDGRILIRTGAVDIGQGTDSGMLVMAVRRRALRKSAGFPRPHRLRRPGSVP